MPESESMRERTESLASMGPSLAYLPTCTTRPKFGGWLEGDVERERGYALGVISSDLVCRQRDLC